VKFGHFHRSDFTLRRKIFPSQRRGPATLHDDSRPRCGAFCADIPPDPHNDR
jgi:hypothetical protein